MRRVLRTKNLQAMLFNKDHSILAFLRGDPLHMDHNIVLKAQSQAGFASVWTQIVSRDFLDAFVRSFGVPS